MTVRKYLDRVHVLLRREGWVINMKKTRRIYNELGLQLRNEHPKRRVKAKLREDRQEAVGPNDVWAMDFVHDQLALGKKLRILTVVDTHYLEEIRDGFQAQRVISTWMAFYNTKRPHSSLERRTPREAYWAGRDQRLAA